MNINSILIALLSGLSFFIGYFIVKCIKNENKLITFAVGFSFSIIIGLAFSDILPECLELDNKLIMTICVIGGIVLLKLLDVFIPDHDHNSKKNNHMQHIGLISALALFLHNIVEGTAIYTTSITDLKLGLFMALGVSFHNIPLGIQISSLIHKKHEKILLLTCLAFSSIIGVIIINVFNLQITELLSGILICVTLGMLIYIALFELLCEVKENIKKKELQLGLLIGLLFIIIGHLLH